MGYTTRYVIDIEWEGVWGAYGDENGRTDCGTVVTLIDFLKKAVNDGKVFDPETNLTAVKADWISFSTNVKHPTTMIIGGKALHPSLRESKGLWNK